MEKEDNRKEIDEFVDQIDEDSLLRGGVSLVIVIILLLIGFFLRDGLVSLSGIILFTFILIKIFRSYYKWKKKLKH